MVRQVEEGSKRLLVRFRQTLPDFDMTTATEAEIDAGMEALCGGLSATMEGRAAVEKALGADAEGRPTVSEGEDPDVLLELVYALRPGSAADAVIQRLQNLFKEKLPEIKGVEFIAISA